MASDDWKNASLLRCQECFDGLLLPVQIASADGTVVYSNAADGRRLGCAPATIVGTKLWDRLPTNEERQKLQADIRYLIEKQPEPEPYVTRNVIAGKVKPIRVVWDYVRDERGTVQGFRSFLLEVPEAIRLRDLSAFSQGVVAAQEQERKRIVHVLHDNVLQQLAAVTMQLDSAPKPLSESDCKALNAAIRNVSNDLRNITNDIRPTSLSDLGLAAALRQLCEHFKAASGMAIEFAAERLETRYSIDIEDNLFRIAQESLSNAIRHSGASRIRVSLSEKPGSILLSIEDDGCGFRGKETPTGGLGLLHIRERVALLGGEAAFEEPATGGVRVRVELPREPG